MRIITLKNRKEFTKLSSYGKKIILNNLIFLYMEYEENFDRNNAPFVRIGLVASKKIGNAVKRNRAKRRLKAAINLTIKVNSAPFYDFVLIARKNILTSDFQQIVTDINYALKKANLNKHFKICE